MVSKAALSVSLRLLRLRTHAYACLQNSSSLPLVRAPPDALRHGFYSASEDVRAVHEVQHLQTMVSAFVCLSIA